MKLKTRVFGEIDIDDEKIITFENGIIGFPDLKRFTLISVSYTHLTLPTIA